MWMESNEFLQQKLEFVQKKFKSLGELEMTEG